MRFPTWSAVDVQLVSIWLMSHQRGQRAYGEEETCYLNPTPYLTLTSLPILVSNVDVGTLAYQIRTQRITGAVLVTKMQRRIPAEVARVYIGVVPQCRPMLRTLRSHHAVSQCLVRTTRSHYYCPSLWFEYNARTSRSTIAGRPVIRT